MAESISSKILIKEFNLVHKSFESTFENHE